VPVVVSLENISKVTGISIDALFEMAKETIRQNKLKYGE